MRSVGDRFRPLVCSLAFMRLWMFLVCALLAIAACAPSIGDSCGGSRDCSTTGDRVCDLAQPGGYCTILGCDPDTCPGSSLCVEWRFEPGRLAETWCMAACSGGCRALYQCVPPDAINMDGTLNTDQNGQPERSPNPAARIIDLEDSKVNASACIAVVTDVQDPTDTGTGGTGGEMSEADAP